MNTLGDRIKHFREIKGMSQQDLAARSGVSQTTISDLENNNQESTRKIFEIAMALEIPVAALAPNSKALVEYVEAAKELDVGTANPCETTIEQAMAVAEGAMLSVGLDPALLGELRELLRECLEEPLVLSDPRSEADSRRTLARASISRFLKQHAALSEK